MRTNMGLGQSINTYDPVLALRGQTGTFQVKTPSGEEVFLTCHADEGLVGIQWGSQPQQPFLVTKISEPVTRRLEGSGTIKEIAS